jgi:hypothetical protein
MKTHMMILLYVGLTMVCGQGCVQIPTTPEVSGLVIDATTHQPIAGAQVGFKEHDHTFNTTARDGSFRLVSDHATEFLPWEFTPCGGLFFVQANGYALFKKEIGPREYGPYIFTQPIALTRNSN